MITQCGQLVAPHLDGISHLHTKAILNLPVLCSSIIFPLMSRFFPFPTGMFKVIQVQGNGTSCHPQRMKNPTFHGVGDMPPHHPRAHVCFPLLREVLFGGRQGGG